MAISAEQVAGWCGGRVEGPGQAFSGLEAMDFACETELTFCGKGIYAKKLKEAKAGGAIVSEGLAVERREGQTVIWVENADLAVAKVLEKIAPEIAVPAVGVDKTAVVDGTAKLGEGVRIGPFVVVQAGAVIGDGCVLMAQVFVGAETVLGEGCFVWPNVCIRERCTVGKRVILHAGVVIGADGFGYRFQDGKHVKIPQIGTVEIGDDCEIGANSTVDRGKFSATVVGAGSKVDNLVQIGHNVRLGQHSILVAHTAIGGSVQTGPYLVMGGAAVIGDHLKIGTAVQVGAMAAVAGDTPDQAKVAGIPARPIREALADHKARLQLPKLIETVRQLEQRIASLESSTKDHSP